MGKLDTAVWVSWRERAEHEKKTAHKTDSDLAAEVSELVGYEVKRALVNHWFRGRRTPDLKEFMALCTALGADPGQILLNVRISYQQASGETSQALIERAPSPAYLSAAARRLKRAKPATSKPPVKPKTRA